MVKGGRGNLNLCRRSKLECCPCSLNYLDNFLVNMVKDRPGKLKKVDYDLPILTKHTLSHQTILIIIM